MSRKIQKMINSDRQIIELRMQAEELINLADTMTYGEYSKEAARIESLINKRVEEIYNESVINE